MFKGLPNQLSAYVYKLNAMNILYIIGNGLDIAHHMKTSYQDFFTHYLALPTIDRDIVAMKKDIESHKYETWLIWKWCLVHIQQNAQTRIFS